MSMHVLHPCATLSTPYEATQADELTAGGDDEGSPALGDHRVGRQVNGVVSEPHADQAAGARNQLGAAGRPRRCGRSRRRRRGDVERRAGRSVTQPAHGNYQKRRHDYCSEPENGEGRPGNAALHGVKRRRLVELKVFTGERKERPSRSIPRLLGVGTKIYAGPFEFRGSPQPEKPKQMNVTVDKIVKVTVD